ncbi:MAG: hypothetical protein VW831_17690, partial [Gammaproteobacteria bacterium]
AADPRVVDAVVADVVAVVASVKTLSSGVTMPDWPGVDWQPIRLVVPAAMINRIEIPRIDRV